MDSLRLPASVRDPLLTWAVEGWPREVCGLLVGRRRPEAIEIVRATWAANTRQDRSGDRYEIAPEDFLDTLRQARNEGLEVLGAWHSHPDHPAVPSATDRELAWPDWTYIIISVRQGRVEGLRSWYFASEGLLEQHISTSPE